jgi:hypothetical protein
LLARAGIRRLQGEPRLGGSGSFQGSGEFELRKMFMATAATLALLAGCDRERPDDVSDVLSAPFDLAKCVPGLEVTAGDGVQIPATGCVASPAKAYVMVMQPLGSLEVMPLTPEGRPGAPAWTSSTRGASPGSALGLFQSDGNLVIYDQPIGKLLWNSGSVAPLGDFQLALTDLGEIIIRPSNGQPVWSSKTGLPAPAGGTPAP